MARKPKPDYYVAKVGFVTMLNGDQTFVAADDVVAAGHDLLKGREDLFKPWPGPRFDVEKADEPDTGIEQATSAPGEKRNR